MYQHYKISSAESVRRAGLALVRLVLARRLNLLGFSHGHAYAWAMPMTSRGHISKEIAPKTKQLQNEEKLTTWMCRSTSRQCHSINSKLHKACNTKTERSSTQRLWPARVLVYCTMKSSIQSNGKSTDIDRTQTFTEVTEVTAYNLRKSRIRWL